MDGRIDKYHSLDKMGIAEFFTHLAFKIDMQALSAQRMKGPNA